MGRLQKKKTDTQIRKKKQKIEAAKSTEAKTPSVDSVSSSADSKVASGSRSVATPQKDTIVTKGLQFFREAKAELNKVTWPSRNQTMASTAVVIVLVLILSLFLGVVDAALTKLVRLVLN